jgi:lipoprotein-anchoring transpeptidase ErfK/SrfK
MAVMGTQVNKLNFVSMGACLWTALSFASSPPALAMDGWVDGRPVFDSDRRRNDQYADRERQSQYNTVFPEFMDGGGQPSIIPEAPPLVQLANAEQAGTIIIDSGGRRLYYVLPGNRAYEYPISVGREGFNWTGTETISRVADWPDWYPPAEMRERQPGLPKKMTGGLKNPLGAKSLYLGNTLYRIHGTNDPTTIGLAASSGCFRMMNQHVAHLATMAGVGTPVRVVSHYGGSQSAER